MTKKMHKLLSYMGFSLGGYQACIKYGCKEYCGDIPSETVKFYERRAEIGISSWLLNVMNIMPARNIEPPRKRKWPYRG